MDSELRVIFHEISVTSGILHKICHKFFHRLGAKYSVKLCLSVFTQYNGHAFGIAAVIL